MEEKGIKTSDIQNESQKIFYPKGPPKDENIKAKEVIISLSSNLMMLRSKDSLKKIYIYHIDIIPEIPKDNFALENGLYKNIEEPLKEFFDKISFLGNNLFGITSNPKEKIILEVTTKDIIYKIIFSKVSSLDFNVIFDNDIINHKKKSFIKKLIKHISLSLKCSIKFENDRMIMKAHKDKNILNNDNSTIFKGYYTSLQITENGLYMMVLSIPGKTMLEKINQIKDENKSLSNSEIMLLIKEFIMNHNIVLTSYGSKKVYKIHSIDFDRTPSNTSFNHKNQKRINETITIMNYYENKYNIMIKDKNQPLLSVEDTIRKERLLKNENSKNKENENKSLMYLVPELVFITGIENNSS